MNPRTIALVFGLGVLAVVLQGSVLKALSPSLVVPNLILLLVIFLAFYEVSVVGAVSAFFLGLLMDLSSASLLGPWAGSCVAVYGVLSAISQRIFIESSIALSIAVFFSSLFCSFVRLLLTYQFQPVGGDVLFYTTLEAFLSGLASIVVFPFLRRITLHRRRLRG